MLDGARLGARVVSGHLARFGFDAAHGASTFALDHKASIGFWRDTVERLSALPPTAEPAAVTGAVATFEAFRTIVCRAHEGGLQCRRIPAPI